MSKASDHNFMMFIYVSFISPLSADQHSDAFSNRGTIIDKQNIFFIF